jgi:hypothetical protein
VKRRILKQRDIEQVFQSYVQQQYPGSNKWRLWMSETLAADLKLSLFIKPGLVQAFFIGVNCPAFVLTLHDEESKGDVEDYANRTAAALQWAIHDYCYLDFLLLPCMLVNSLSLEFLTAAIKSQLADRGQYFGGRKLLDEDMFSTLLKATTALVGCTSIPSEWQKSSTLLQQVFNL